MPLIDFFDSVAINIVIVDEGPGPASEVGLDEEVGEENKVGGVHAESQVHGVVAPVKTVPTVSCKCKKAYIKNKL